MTFLAIFQVPIANLALSLVYFAIGYTLFACLMAGTGALGRTPHEGAQVSAIWTLRGEPDGLPRPDLGGAERPAGAGAVILPADQRG
jgi:hypothetical protein